LGRVPKRSKTWLAVALVIVAVQALVALAVPRHGTIQFPFHYSVHGATLQTFFGDIAQFAIVTFAGIVMLRNGLRSRGAARVFWTLMSLGLFFWDCDLAIWGWYEVVLRVEVPHLTIGDTFLFLHLVPMVAALGARPDRPTRVLGRQRTWLDFSVLLTYWLYFYALLVMPYQYVVPDLPTYNFNFDIIDKAGHWILVLALFVAYARTQGPWRRIYGFLTFASLSYAIFSDVANLAVDQDAYYTGSAYDILLIATMCGFAYTALEARWIPDTFADSDDVSLEIPKHALQWPALISMFVTLSTPVLGICFLKYSSYMNPAVREFRLIITLCAMLLLVFLVFLKQSLLQRDLVQSLSSVSDAYTDLKNVKNQLVQSEKLASMGRLLAGAAHEINNPLTAILGYSDLIVSSPNMEPQARSMGEKIAQQARRTKMLVEDLLKFSQETPTLRSSNDVHVLVNNAVKIAGLDSPTPIDIEVSAREGLPPVIVDAGQILQVFVHLIRNAAEAMREAPVRKLHISMRGGTNQVQVEFADSGVGVRDPDLVFDPFYTTKSPGKGTGLGLSACYGIIQKHGGQISCQNRPQGGAIFTVTLPTAEQTELQNA
jgi:signal transduction histidine kinase